MFLENPVGCTGEKFSQGKKVSNQQQKCTGEIYASRDLVSQNR